MTQDRVSFTLLGGFLLCVACVLLLGCNQPLTVPSRYDSRETEQGIWIFEFKQGNQGNSGNTLAMFMESLATWKQQHPDLEVVHLESINSNINYRQSASIVNIIVYTKPKVKP